LCFLKCCRRLDDEFHGCPQSLTWQALLEFGSDNVIFSVKANDSSAKHAFAATPQNFLAN